MKLVAILAVSLVATPALSESVLSGPKVLAANDTAITIKHAHVSKKSASEKAITHCAQYGKVAILVSSQKQMGLAFYSSWQCQ